ncbi:MAG: hypothetical protein ACI84D_002314 [Thalassolituus oleivorans]|jgi:hypothetical protein
MVVPGDEADSRYRQEGDICRDSSNGQFANDEKCAGDIGFAASVSADVTYALRGGQRIGARGIDLDTPTGRRPSFGGYGRVPSRLMSGWKRGLHSSGCIHRRRTRSSGPVSAASPALGMRWYAHAKT